ncbi:hypothetical protein KQH82_10845 [bacterium]|nr:hypothetical protein [bacterium]
MRSILVTFWLVIVTVAGSAGQTQPPVIVGPATISAPYCDLLQFNFDLANPCTGAVFSLVSGPGAIDPTTGLWSYQPRMADVGQVMAIEVSARCPSGVTAAATVQLQVTNEPPVFTSCPVTSLTADAGYVRTVVLAVDDTCPDSLRFRILSDGGMDGTVSVSGSPTGVVRFIGANSDFGRVDIRVAVNDGLVEDTCSIRFFVAPTACEGGETGDIDNSGNIDLSDLLDLVNILFYGQQYTRSLVFANINGDPTCRVDISDLIHLVNYLFLQGPSPAPCLQVCEHTGTLMQENPNVDRMDERPGDVKD